MAQLGEYAIYFLMGMGGMVLMLLYSYVPQYSEAVFLLPVGFLVSWVGFFGILFKVTHFDSLMKGVFS